MLVTLRVFRGSTITYVVLTEKTILDSRKAAMELNPLLMAKSHAVSPFLFSS